MRSAELSEGRRWPAVSLVVVLALIAVTPALLGGARYGYDMAVVAMAYGMFAVSWDIACGTTRELSFGHSFFVGTAGFAAAIAMGHYQADPWIAVLIGAVVGAAAGLLIGVLTLRHTGPVFTLVTMAAQLTLYRTVFVWGSVFGGEEGVPFSVQWLEGSVERWLFIATVSVTTLVAGEYLVTSPFGLRLRASGGDRRVGESAGVDVDLARMQGFALSGLVAGVAASILVLHNSIANYELTGDRLAGLIFLLSLVGGMGTLVGPWIAAFLYMTLLRESLYGTGQWHSVIAMLIVFVLLWLMPRGVMGTLPRLRMRRPALDEHRS